MEASEELSLVPKVQLQQKYWVTEESKAKLLALGAKYLDIVTHREHYYDTVSDELAMAQLWLSQRNQQWCLLIESREPAAEKNDAHSFPDPWGPPHENRTENVQNSNPTIYNGSQEKKPTQLLNNQNDQQQDLSKDVCTEPGTTYIELVGESKIITYLADFLHIDLETEEEENMAMEDFLQRAGIQCYASNHTVSQTTYMLCNQYTIIIQRDNCCLKESAVVLLEEDISNICKGFEKIEKLANYLRFELQNAQI